ncbi:hypothetical protein FEM48_ZijujUnG0111200 [Ziziphus jujuba var. spinosa]|uniref:Sieve element occlusion C-terminal domain-containing protein n=1 Tax=Ziziphus jujuba var. spinosa TaxID=714518 RepID=A0A978U807_ZIZJJ|nr:hypothetical protein FEM48_ZijujUnG0111200 [Ziziphus jujuba var. spinosa]
MDTGEMKYDEEYRNLIRIFESSHIDNSKVIRALLAPKDETKVLVIRNDMAKKPVSIDELIGKHVPLIISDLNLPCEEIQVFVTVYGMRHDVQSEMVWIPVVTGWQEQNQYKFAELQAVMPWYTVTTPLVIEPTVIGYVKEYWKFDRKTILVALDPLGKIKENRYICVYGGDNTDWIRDFTTKAKNVAKALNITIELIYAGKNNTSKKGLERIFEVIEKEKLSLFWPDYTSTWFFWSRLESMRISKTRHGKTVEERSDYEGNPDHTRL